MRLELGLGLGLELELELGLGLGLELELELELELGRSAVKMLSLHEVTGWRLAGSKSYKPTLPVISISAV